LGEDAPRSPRRAGIIGWPVDQSLSPVIHNAAFQALGLDWVYELLPVEPGALPSALTDLQTRGYSGANVTMPHKEEAARLVRTRSDDAELLEAVNTIVFGKDGPAGYNTDAPGFARFLEEDTNFDLKGATALVLGAGGAARACALALIRCGVDRVVVAARHPERAEAFDRLFTNTQAGLDVIAWADAVSTPATVVVNATPVKENLPLPDLGPRTLVVDLAYRPAVTPLVGLAQQAGAPAFGGLGLLLHQAALSFELWTGQPPLLDVMSAAAKAELSQGEQGLNTP
jgi:shikimate dehydrogenase